MNILSIEYFSHLVNPNITSTIARSSAPHGHAALSAAVTSTQKQKNAPT